MSSLDPQTAPAPPVATRPPGAPIVNAAGNLQLPSGVGLCSPWRRLGAWALEALLIMATLGIGWLIWAAILAPGGQTPAKQLLQMRVIRANTLRPAGFAMMFFMRGIVAGFVAYWAILFTLGILLFMPFWDTKNQNVWDKVSSTLVVHDPANQLAAWV